MTPKVRYALERYFFISYKKMKIKVNEFLEQSRFYAAINYPLVPSLCVFQMTAFFVCFKKINLPKIRRKMAALCTVIMPRWMETDEFYL